MSKLPQFLQRNSYDVDSEDGSQFSHKTNPRTLKEAQDKEGNGDISGLDERNMDILKFSESSFTDINDNMSPILLDLLLSTDQEIQDKAFIFINHINEIMDQSDVPLTNDPNFIKTIEIIFKEFQNEAAELTLENLETYKVPQKLLLYHQSNNRYQMFNEMLNSKAKDGVNKSQLHNKYIYNYFGDFVIPSLSNSSKNPDDGQDLEKIDLLVKESVENLKQINFKLKSILQDDLNEQNELKKALRFNK